MTSFQKIIKYAGTALAIILIVGIIGGIFQTVGQIAEWTSDRKENKNAVISDNGRFEASEQVNALEIDMGAGELRIEYGDKLSVAYDASFIDVSVVGEKLKIKSKKIKIHDTQIRVVITLPEENRLREADIELGAGSFFAEKLEAEEISFEVGAGRLQIDDLFVSRRAEIEGGAGEIVIGGGEINNLKVSCGLGRTEIKARLLGSSKIECGLGETDLTLNGAETEYTLRFSTGLGSFTYNGRRISSLTTYGSGENTVKVEGGMGSVNVKTSDEL